jgi:hypothetical protein
LDVLNAVGTGEWALKDNLVPVDRKSMENALQHKRTTMIPSLPNFNLTIGYYDVNIEDGASKDLVKIRYRRQGRDDGCDLRAGSLDCEFKRQYWNELHRRSWITEQHIKSRGEEDDPMMDWLRDFRRDYPKHERDYLEAFPETVDVAGGALSQ